MSVASPTSKSMKKPDVNDASESILLSVVQPTSSSIYDVAEERHLQELALQFAESSSAAEAPATPCTLPQTSDNPIDAEERARRQAAKARSPSLPAGPAERGPEQSVHTVPGAAGRTTPVTPITVSLIQQPVAKLQAPIATPVTSLTSSVLATVSSLFGAPVVLTPTPPSAPMGSYGIVPQLQNIVATVNLCCPLDLRQIALRARNAEYNPRRFAAVIMRIREPRTTALLFRSGKIVCTGARSELQARTAARKFARIAQKLGYNAKFNDFKVQNIVASCDVGFSIKLESLALNHAQFSCYEPELFPGLVYRMVKPCILLLVFVSGKVVLTGAKLREDIYKAFENIYPILKKYQSL